MKKILVTGANGFIGKHVLPLLSSKGYEVYALQRSKVSNQDKCHSVICDLSNEEQVRGVLCDIGPTHLLHLAWYTEHGKFWDSLENIDWIRRSVFLVKTFADFGGQRALVVGSCAEYSWDRAILSEEANSYRPSSLYGQSKNFLRMLLDNLCKERGVSFAWPRIFFLFGAEEPKGKIVASMIAQFIQDQTFILKNGSMCRDFLHVKDVAHALVHIMDSSFQGAINIGSGEGVDLLTLGKTIQTLVGAGSLSISNENLPLANLPKKLIADVTGLKTTLGWKPAFTLEEGLLDVIQSWKENLRRNS